MTYPLTEPTSYPLPTNWTNASTQQASDYNNTEGAANYGWAAADSGPARARVACTGSETYTIAAGTVTTITGTTIDSVSVAVNDVVLIATAPASSGAGTLGSYTTQPGNGLYYVSAVATNISVSRLPMMSSTSANKLPQAFAAFIGNAGAVNGLTMWVVAVPTSSATFTYGTTSMLWNRFDWVSPVLTSPTLTTPTISSPTITGTGIPNAAIQQAGINNFNHALQSQTVVSGTAYYVTNSGLTMPASALNGMTANKTAFVWNIAMAKTAAGTGTFQVVLYRGTNGTTSDTADVTQTIGTQTAVIDELLLNIQLVVTTTGATGGYYWSIIPDNRASVPATAAGFGVPGTASNAYLNGTVSAVAMNTASLIFGIGFIATTGTPTITVPMVQAFAFNMD